MKFIFASYVVSHEFKDPETWLYRIRAYTGMLESLSINNEVISIEQIDHEGEYSKNGVKYRFLRSSHLGRYFPQKLHRFIQSQQPDVVIVHGLHYPLQVMQLRGALGKKVKIIAQNHSEKPFTGIRKYIQRLAGNAIDAYLFPAHGTGMDWVKKGNIADAAKIHEVMEVSSVFYPIERSIAIKKTAVTGSKVFLCVMRFSPTKDPLTVVKAFLEYAALKPGACLYIIHHTNELLPQVQQTLAGSLQKKAIVLVGKVPHDELLYWYNSADFFISGSHYEGTNASLCEAMSCGCVPLVTDIAPFRSMTDDGRCGILYEAGNYHALLTAWNETPQMNLQQKRQATLNYFETNLSFEAIAGRINEIAAAL